MKNIYEYSSFIFRLHRQHSIFPRQPRQHLKGTYITDVIDVTYKKYTNFLILTLKDLHNLSND